MDNYAELLGLLPPVLLLIGSILLLRRSKGFPTTMMLLGSILLVLVWSLVLVRFSCAALLDNIQTITFWGGLVGFGGLFTVGFFCYALSCRHKT